MAEVLPYLEISSETEEIEESVEMPNVTGMEFKEAKSILKEVGLETNSELGEESIISDQLPKSGIQIKSGTEVILYSE